MVKGFPDEPTANAALMAGEIDLLASGNPTVANTAEGFTYTVERLITPNVTKRMLAI